MQSIEVEKKIDTKRGRKVRPEEVTDPIGQI
jgi:hypothetical protein